MFGRAPATQPHQVGLRSEYEFNGQVIAADSHSKIHGDDLITETPLNGNILLDQKGNADAFHLHGERGVGLREFLKDDTQRGELSGQTFAPLHAAFDVINEAALQTNSIAFQAISTVWQTAELLGPATKSLGLLAGAGNEDALEMLLHPEQYGLTLSTTVAALRHAADNGNQKAIETLDRKSVV